MSITNKQRFEILRRDAFTCQYCGKTGPTARLEVDHIEPESKGGTDEEGNLITSCFDCNRGKSDSPIINQSDKMSEADHVYQLINFPPDFNHAIEMIEKYLHGAIVKCLEKYPRPIVCLAVILEGENVDSDCGFVEYESEDSVVSTLDENCRILQEYWVEISPYKIVRLIAGAEHESMCKTYSQLSRQYNMVPKEDYNGNQG